jgi:CDP-glucose 4,6-dehydratase
MNKPFWKGKRVFLTGHTGFKGSWLALTLNELGAEVTGYSDKVPTNPSLFELARIKSLMKSDIRGDIRDFDNLKKAMKAADPEVVFHLAAQPLVRKSYLDPIETYSTNVMGTLNLLLASIEVISLKSIACITTDKCYENQEWIWPYRETDALGGHDPYSSSKACTEIVSASMRSSFLKSKGINLATMRAGNVIGGGDWAVDRIIPDLVRAFQNKEKLEIRNPKAIRPWQHVMEPVIGYMTLAEKMNTEVEFAEAWNFGPELQDCLSVEEVVNQILQSWDTHPGWKFTGDPKGLHEANVLKLDCSKAKVKLGWKPRMSLQESLNMTSDWYQAYFSQKDMKDVTLKQIHAFLG